MAAVVEECRKGAEQGDAEDQFNLGSMYCYGDEGVATDIPTAIEWFVKAADQKHAPALYTLGNIYASGKGVAKDEATAAEWYRKAAAEGHAMAHCNLGVMYADGKGVDQSDATAVEWYRKAANQGMAEAMCYLGFMYQHGRGVEKDATRAVAYYKKGADQGFAKAQCNLALMYRDGEGIAKDELIAADLLRRAAQQGLAAAQCALAIMLIQGEGVKRNLSEANNWLHKADAQSYPGAAELLKGLSQVRRGKDELVASLTSMPPDSPLRSLLTIPIGAKVELCGLQAKPELNGQRGVVESFNRKTKRYSVREEGGCSRLFRAKTGNLLVLEVGEGLLE